MELIGKVQMTVVCPLCKYMYTLEDSEFQHTSIKIQDASMDKDFNVIPAVYEERIKFYCPECNRNVLTNRYEERLYTDQEIRSLNNEMEIKRKG